MNVRILELIEEEIASQSYGTSPRSLYEPIRYIMKLGGKRIRPLLTCLSYSVFRDDVEKVVPVAACVETFHNFTLMHDDIMDNAPLRRGKPTVHEKWNISTAILAGDVMLVKVYDMMMDTLSEQHARTALSIFNRAAVEVCEGQQMDMDFEQAKRVTEEQYISMIKLKTAALIGFSLELGALLAGASEQDRAALRQFGINMGIGFQLHDDYLDVYANGGKFGKQVGGDIISNKKTYLLIKALELARGKSRTELLKWINARSFVRSQKVKAVTRVYDSLGIPAMSREKTQSYFNQALGDLSAVDGNLGDLKEFAVGLMRRVH
jgi:geranylgeranyl diphosphate synthase type II